LKTLAWQENGAFEKQFAELVSTFLRSLIKSEICARNWMDLGVLWAEIQDAPHDIVVM